MTPTLQTLDALHARLDTHPDDWATRQVLADLLTDLGRDDEAACQRWMAVHRRCPLYDRRLAGFRWWRSYSRLSHFRRQPGSHPYDLIPVDLHDRMPQWGGHTRRAAEDALLAALRAAGEI